MISRLGGVLNMAFQVSIPAGLLLAGVLIDLVPVYALFIPLAVFLFVFIAVFSGGLFPKPDAGLPPEGPELHE
jgi:hypothetical protein